MTAPAVFLTATEASTSELRDARVLKHSPCLSYRTRSFKCERECTLRRYPELVDLRVLTDRWVEEQALGVHRFLGGDSNLSHVHKWRKKASIAERWISQIRVTGLLSLRDPARLDDESRALPCNFSIVERTLRCAGHVSAAWPWAPWWRACGIAMCGHLLGGWVFQPWPNVTLGRSKRATQESLILSGAEREPVKRWPSRF